MIMLFVILGLCFVSHVLLVFLLLKINHHAKTYLDNNKDMAEALSNIMSYLTNRFDINFDNVQKQQQWFESNLNKLSEVNTQNSQKIYNSLHQSQVFLNSMAEFLGYRPKSNLGE